MPEKAVIAFDLQIEKALIGMVPNSVRQWRNRYQRFTEDRVPRKPAAFATPMNQQLAGRVEPGIKRLF